MAIAIDTLITGWLTLPKEFFLKGETGTIRVPIPCYLIHHPKGLLLFDSGVHPEMSVDPVRRLGRDLSFEYSLDNLPDVASQLKAKGIEPSDIVYLINSHLHFDHAGGNSLIPKATVIVQQSDWQVTEDPKLSDTMGFFPCDFDTQHKKKIITGKFDLFNDGTITCLPTPGHTPGHQSLWIKSENQNVILAADACDLKENLEQMIPPGVAWDDTQTVDSLKLLNSLRQEGAKVVPGHDERCFNNGKLIPF